MLVALLGLACSDPAPPDPVAPDPIGDELLRVEDTWAWPPCSSSRLVRSARQIQYQCFDEHGVFSWDNRGTLSAEASEQLDAQLAAAAPEDDEPVNYMGLCDSPDAFGTITLWVDERALSFAPFCLTQGVLPLYEQLWAIQTDISNCQEPFTTLESIEAGCTAY